ncbi:MAG: glycosyltransferase family 4 protein [Myxococcales bacterium]|nr:MAG: glycosyltransferase family 4 protein [Myxococcales bacterium]
MVQAFGPVTFGLVAFSLAASAVGVRYAIRVAQRVGLLDVPNERSSHTSPTPRMGGVPMVVAAALAFGGWMFLAAGEIRFLKGLPYTFLFALAMFLLGFYDDLRNLSPLVRFLVQFASASLMLGFLAPHLPDVFLGKWVFPEWAWVIPGAFWAVWMLNLYNFMDGIDGLAGGEAAVASSFFFLVFAWYGESGWAIANLVVAAASMGFLVYNWPPAKIFMGDGGSAFLGAFYGMQSVVAALSTPVPFPVLVLPFANFILDTTFTLLRRMFRGEKWYQAHRSHFYQRMTDLGMTHRKVTSIELLVVAASCAVAAACIQAEPAMRIALAVSVAAGIACGGLWVRGKESPRNRTPEPGRS